MAKGSVVDRKPYITTETKDNGNARTKLIFWADEYFPYSSNGVTGTVTISANYRTSLITQTTGKIMVSYSASGTPQTEILKPTSNSQSSSHIVYLFPGAVAGISIGIAIAGALIFGLMLLGCRRWRAKRAARARLDSNELGQREEGAVQGTDGESYTEQSQANELYGDSKWQELDALDEKAKARHYNQTFLAELDDRQHSLAGVRTAATEAQTGVPHYELSSGSDIETPRQGLDFRRRSRPQLDNDALHSELDAVESSHTKKPHDSLSEEEDDTEPNMAHPGTRVIINNLRPPPVPFASKPRSR